LHTFADYAPAPLPKPGVSITAVTRRIWFGGLPPNIAEPDLFKEASFMGDVQFIVFPACSGRDEALVTFTSFGYAASLTAIDEPMIGFWPCHCSCHCSFSVCY